MPVESGFLETPVSLKNIDFSRQDAEEIVAETIASFEIKYPDLITDYNKSQVARMLLEATAKMSERLSYKAEMQVKNVVLATSRHRPSVAKVLNTIGYEMGRALSASGSASATINSAITEDVLLPIATQIKIEGSDSLPLYFEIFNVVNGVTDYESTITIPAGQLANTDLVCIEGRTTLDTFIHNTAGAFPRYILDEKEVLNDYFKVAVNGVLWQRVETIIYQSTPGPFYEVNHLSDGTTTIKFGNGLSGAIPQLGSEIEVKYRTGGGQRGLVVANYFNVNLKVFVGGSEQRTVQVSIKNTTDTIGGADEESLEHAKLYGPKYYAALGKGGTGEDYTTIANLHSSSLGSVLKAIATHRGYASALGQIEGPFTIGSTNNRLALTTASGDYTVTLTEGVKTAQEIADDLASQGQVYDFTGGIHENKVIVASVKDDEQSTKLEIRDTSDSAHHVLGLPLGHYAQWSSRHVDIYAFARGPLDSRGIITAVPLTQQQKDELAAKLSQSDTKMLTDEIEVKDAGYKLVDITATVQVNNGFNLQVVEEKVLDKVYKMFDPELWSFGQRLNTVEIEKTIYNASEGIEDIILTTPQTAVIPTSFQLISRGNISIEFEYIG